MPIFHCIHSGVKQGDALFETLFNIVLEKVKGYIECKGPIINKGIQVIADDIVIITRTERKITETYRLIESKANNMD